MMVAEKDVYPACHLPLAFRSASARYWFLPLKYAAPGCQPEPRPTFIFNLPSI